ncbi:unnamed protein product [Paramecium sonneborni]|uniref:Uncharacterized protein n=1 Tax=Paramecium sonneborni TaxID=65129 RepID=A0A8S1PZ52_9CILI|nr:unnamed protein product [Paramecium sonneborni]
MQLIFVCNIQHFYQQCLIFSQESYCTILNPYTQYLFLLILRAVTQNYYIQKYAYNLKLELSYNPFLFETTNHWVFPFDKAQYIESFYDIHQIRSYEFKEYLQQFVVESFNTDANSLQSKYLIDDYIIQIFANYQILRIQHIQNIEDGRLKQSLQQTYYQMAIYLKANWMKVRPNILNNLLIQSIIQIKLIINNYYLQPYIFASRKKLWLIWINDFQEIFSYFVITQTQLMQILNRICIQIFLFLIYFPRLKYQ